MHLTINSSDVRCCYHDWLTKSEKTDLLRKIASDSSGTLAVSLCQSPNFDFLFSLLEAARQNDKIVRLHVYGNCDRLEKHSDTDVSPLLNKLFQIRGLQSVGLQTFYFSTERIESICDWAAASSTLQHLYLEGNDLTNDGLRAVERVVVKNKFLKTLRVSIHVFTESGAVESFVQCLRRNFEILNLVVSKVGYDTAFSREICQRNSQWIFIRQHLIFLATALFFLDFPLYVILELANAYLIVMDSYKDVAEKEFPQYLKVQLLENVAQHINRVILRRETRRNKRGISTNQLVL